MVTQHVQEKQAAIGNTCAVSGKPRLRDCTTTPRSAYTAPPITLTPHKVHSFTATIRYCAFPAGHIPCTPCVLPSIPWPDFKYPPSPPEFTSLSNAGVIRQATEVKTKGEITITQYASYADAKTVHIASFGTDGQRMKTIEAAYWMFFDRGETQTVPFLLQFEEHQVRPHHLSPIHSAFCICILLLYIFCRYTVQWPTLPCPPLLSFSSRPGRHDHITALIAQAASLYHARVDQGQQHHIPSLSASPHFACAAEGDGGC
jgi:hypothetical protein